MALALLLASGAGRSADAACNLIPGTSLAFRGVVGTTDRPFARPGDFVTVRLDSPCHAEAPGFSPDPVVTIAFRPLPAASRHLVVVATACGGLTACPPPPALARPPGSDLNGDGDATDTVVHVARRGAPVLNLGRAAVAVALSPAWVAALVSERAEGGPIRPAPDLNGDGDTADVVVEVHAADGTGPWRTTGPRGQAADVVAVSGALIAFLTPEAAQGEDRNGDGDRRDRVLQLYDASADELIPVGQPAEEFVLSPGLVAFRTRETAACVGPVTTAECAAPPGCPPATCDRNGDGDCCDDVLQVYDVTGRRLVPTGQAVTPSSA